jgi:hypothetical protein
MTLAPMQNGPGPMRGNPHGVPLSEFKKMVEKYLNQ